MTRNTPPVSHKERQRKPGQDALDRPLVKRFYDQVTAVEEGGKHHIRLDGKTVRTPSREKLCVTRSALADKICEEWRAQGEFIDPQSMPLTQLANTAIDGVSPKIDQVVASTLNYAGSDLLCYRVDQPESLIDLQRQGWDPVLNWLKETYGAEFILGTGVMYVAQPEMSIAKIETLLQTYDASILSAVHVMTTLTGSLFLALAIAEDHMTMDQAWQAAHIDEDWQFSRWGSDADAEIRREKRFKEMQAAADFLYLARRG